MRKAFMVSLSLATLVSMTAYARSRSGVPAALPSQPAVSHTESISERLERLDREILGRIGLSPKQQDSYAALQARLDGQIRRVVDAALRGRAATKVDRDDIRHRLASILDSPQFDAYADYWAHGQMKRLAQERQHPFGGMCLPPFHDTDEEILAQIELDADQWVLYRAGMRYLDAAKEALRGVWKQQGVMPDQRAFDRLNDIQDAIMAQVLTPAQHPRYMALWGKKLAELIGGRRPAARAGAPMPVAAVESPAPVPARGRAARSSADR